MSFLAGLVIFLVRNDGTVPPSAFLFGCAIGFAAISLSLIKISVDEAAVIPLPAIEFWFCCDFFDVYSNS